MSTPDNARPTGEKAPPWQWREQHVGRLGGWGPWVPSNAPRRQPGRSWWDQMAEGRFIANVQASRPVCGAVRNGSLSGLLICQLPYEHGGEWHEQRIIRRDGSRGTLAKWPNQAALTGKDGGS